MAALEFCLSFSVLTCSFLGNSSLWLIFVVLFCICSAQNVADLGASVNGPSQIIIGFGTPSTYQVNIANAGPNDAPSLDIVILIPSVLQLSSAVGVSNLTCVIESPTRVHCTQAVLAVTNVARALINVTVLSNLTPQTAVINVTSSSAALDPSPGNNNATVSVNLVLSADLAINLQGPSLAVAGQSEVVRRSILVTNLGYSDANNVVATYNVVSPLVYVGSEGLACTFNNATSVATCPIGTLASGSIVSFTLLESVPSNAFLPSGGSVTEVAFVNSTTPDPSFNNNNASITTVVSVMADVSITKGGPASAQAGASSPSNHLVYNLVVDNAGPSDASGVAVVDQVPLPFIVISANASCAESKPGAKREIGPCTGVTPTCVFNTPQNFVRCNIASLTTTQRLYVNVYFWLPVNASATVVTNTAFVGTDSFDNNTARNQDSAVTSIVPAGANLFVAKTGPSILCARQAFPGYNIIITNLGFLAAENVSVLDILPQPLIPGPGNATISGNFSPGATCNITNRVLQCSLGTVAPSATINITFPFYIPSSAPAVASVTNTATASTTTPEVDLTNNAGTFSFPICNLAELTINKTGPITLSGGDTAAYTIVITNNGPSDALNAHFVDVFPAPFVPLLPINTTGGGTCQILTVGGAQNVVCTWSSLALGQTVTAVVPFRVISDPPLGNITNCATVDSDTPHNNLPSTRVSCFDTTIRNLANLVVTKTGPSAVCAGDPVIYFYTVYIANNGLSTAFNVTLFDPVPAQMTLALSPAIAINGNEAAASCQIVNNTVQCTLGRLSAGNSMSVVFPFQVGSNVAAANVTNVAVVSSSAVVATVTAPFSTDICNKADLNVRKSGPPSVVAGSSSVFQFQLTVENRGPSNAIAVLVSDPISPNFLVTGFVSLLTNNCSIASGTLSCFYPVFPSGSVDVISINFTVPANATIGTTQNCVSASSATPDGVSTNNQQCISIQINSDLDVAISKTGPVSVVAGQASASNVFRLVVTNAGKSLALSVVVTDIVPSVFTVGTVQTSQGGCTVTNNTLSCALGSLNPSQSVNISYTFSVAPNAQLGPVTNTACVAANSSAASDTNPGNNCSPFVTTVTCSTELVVTKSNNLTTVVAGSSTVYVYTVTVFNNGPSTSRDTTLSDTWPSSLKLGSIVPSQGACGPSSAGFFCNLGAINPNQTAVVLISYTVPANAVPGNVTNTACASNLCTQVATSVLCGSDTDTIVLLTNLTISKDDNVAVVTPGSQTPYVYTILVTNVGPSDVSNVTVVDQFPPQLEIIDESASSGAQCQVTTGPSSSVTLSCNWALIPSQTSAFIRVQYRVRSDVNVSSITNCAVLTAGATTLQACDTNSLGSGADLGVTKQIDNSACVIAGSSSSRSYTVVVTNFGPSLATNVTVQDAFPSNVTVLAFPSVCTKNVVTGNYSCSLGNLEAGTTRSLVWTFLVDASFTAGILRNGVSVSSNTPDPDACNNNAVVTSLVCLLSDLSVVKSDGVSIVTAGQQDGLVYTITGYNAGPSDAVNVTFVDVWPSRFVLGTITAPGASVKITSDGFIVVLPRLAALSSFSFNVSFSIPACLEACEVCNTVQISSANEDPVVSNNHAVDCDAVRSVADVEVCKSDNVNQVTAGDATRYVYTVQVTNLGPSCAKDVRLIDYFPTVVSQVPGSIIASQGVCSNFANGSSSFSCNLLTLLPGQVVKVQVAYTVPANVTTCSFTNWVSVSSVTLDPALCNNDARDTNSLIESATLTVFKTDGETTIPFQDYNPRTYTITVSNLGPSVARDSVLTDRWPAAIVQLAGTLSSTQGNCTTNGYDFTCWLGDIAVGSSVVVKVKYSVRSSAPCGNFTNEASVFTRGDITCRESVDTTTIACPANSAACSSCLTQAQTTTCAAQAASCTGSNACLSCLQSLQLNASNPSPLCLSDPLACSLYSCLAASACGPPFGACFSSFSVTCPPRTARFTDVIVGFEPSAQSVAPSVSHSLRSSEGVPVERLLHPLPLDAHWIISHTRNIDVDAWQVSIVIRNPHAFPVEMTDVTMWSSRNVATSVVRECKWEQRRVHPSWEVKCQLVNLHEKPNAITVTAISKTGTTARPLYARIEDKN